MKRFTFRSAPGRSRVYIAVINQPGEVEIYRDAPGKPWVATHAALTLAEGIDAFRRENQD